MQRAHTSPWRAEIEDITRALSGAYLFGIPLLFTMEMWWIGLYADLWKLVVFLGLAFLANLALTYFAGFKKQTGLGYVVSEAIEAVAIGVVGSAVVLLVLNRVSFGDPLDSVLGKVIIQAVPLSIGASVANAIFAEREGRSGQDGGGEYSHLKATINDIGATAIGGIFIGFAIAPTEEVPMLASSLEYPHVLALIGLTLMTAYGIVFASHFDSSKNNQGPFQHPITETALAYVVSLVIALVVLYLFDQIELGDPLAHSLTEVLVLGLPVSVGGAAGRLAV